MDGSVKRSPACHAIDWPFPFARRRDKPTHFGVNSRNRLQLASSTLTAPAWSRGVRRKLAAYERHIQLGLMAHGLLQYLAVTFSRAVWLSFHSFIRTATPQKPPSEWVVSRALRHSWPHFLVGSPESQTIKKFLVSKIHLDRCGYADILGVGKAASMHRSPVRSFRLAASRARFLVSSNWPLPLPQRPAPGSAPKASP